MTVSESFPCGGQRLNNDWGRHRVGRQRHQVVPAGQRRWSARPAARRRGHGRAAAGDPRKPSASRSPGVTAAVLRTCSTGRDRAPSDLRVPVSLELDDMVYVQVQRADGMTPADLAVSVTVSTKLSILLGGGRGAPRLMCQDETSGWGADDIELKITVDGDAAAAHQQRRDRRLRPGRRSATSTSGSPTWCRTSTGSSSRSSSWTTPGPTTSAQETLRTRDEPGGLGPVRGHQEPTTTAPSAAHWRIDVDDGTYAHRSA